MNAYAGILPGIGVAYQGEIDCNFSIKIFGIFLICDIDSSRLGLETKPLR